MFKNNLKIAWRNLRSNSLFSAINILGLSMGLCIVFLLTLYIVQERSFDTIYPKKDRIHRVLLQTDENYDFATWATVPPVAGPTLREEIPQVESSARMLKHNFGRPASLKAGQNTFTEPLFYWVDPEFLDIFDLELLQGNPSALDRPNTVLLSQKAAQAYFKGEDPLGRTLLVDNGTELEVTGVYRNFPSNSTMDAEILASSLGSWFEKRDSWSNASFETYLLLGEGASPSQVQAQMDRLLDAHLPKADQWYSLGLQPMARVHLYSASYDNSYTSKIGDIKEVRNLTYLALLILLIACVNYMNLTTARSQKRAKEVGINKTLGASSSTLIRRFYVETGLITGLAMALGIVLAMLLLSPFKTLIGQDIDPSLLLQPVFVLGVLLLWALTTLISGLYPSLYLSRFLPRETLSPGLKGGKGNVLVRQGLVIAQFAASTALIVGVLVIHEQTRYIQSKNLGFTPENVLALSVGGLGTQANRSALAQEIEKQVGVTALAYAQGYPSMGVSGRTLKKNPSDTEGLSINTNVADAGIVEALRLNLLAGSDLPRNKAEGDTLMEVVLNRTAVDFLGYDPREAIGKVVHIGLTYTIVGVVEDFNYESLHRPIGAYAFHNNPSEAKSFMLVRFTTEQLSRTLEGMEAAFNSVAPNLNFEYSFLDRNLEKLYKREKRAAQTSMVFCLLAILVAAMGLFGLAAHTAEQRRKEIGIRKVLGASVASIGRMLSKDFAKLVFLALLIGFPLAYLAMERWLQGFAYRVDIQGWVFVLAGAMALGIALIPIGYQSIRAARVDPARSLRSE